MNLEKQIIKNICLAQIASDGGKGIYSLFLKDEKSLSKKAAIAGYSLKDNFILSAIKLIRNNHKTGWSYKMVESFDQRGNKCRIAYFQYAKGGNYYQISFHTFAKRKYGKIINTGVTCIKWDEGSSRSAAYGAYKLFGGKAYLEK